MSTTTVTPHEVQAPVPSSTQEQVITERKPRDPFQSAVMLMTSWKWPKVSKAVSVEQIDVRGETPRTDKTKVHVSKDLLDYPELKKVQNHSDRVTAFLYRRCSPFPLQRGWYLLPKDFVKETDEFLKNHDAERQPLIEAAVNGYEHAIDEARIFLGPLFHASDYPSRETFKSKFQFKWHYVEVGVSEALREISAEMATREADKLSASWQEAGKACQTLLRASMNDLVSHLCEKLQPTPEGKRRVFRDVMFANIQEFLSTFRSRDLTNDSELADLVNQAQQLVNGVQPSQLKDNEGLRDTVHKGFEEIKRSLANMIEVAPIRQIRLED